MTNEQLQGLREAIDAKLNGKNWQYRSVGMHEWVTQAAESSLGRIEGYEFRAKPEPASRPWSKPEHVPGPVCWIRTSPQEIRMLVICIYQRGLRLQDAGIPPLNKQWGSLTGYEYSTTCRADDWHPCTVTEEPK